MGRRIRKHTAEGTTWFLYVDEGLIAELNVAGEENRYYGWQPAGLWGTDPIWQAPYENNEWAIHLYQNDHLGTPHRMSDPSGEAKWTVRYDAFGGNSAPQTAIENNIKFPGHYNDKEYNGKYNFFRNYNANLGRYLQTDPIGLDGGINQYSYASQSPNLIYDPYGLVNWTGTMVGGSLIAGKGAGFYWFELKSECVKGKMARASVFASSVAVGAGARLTGGGGSVKLHDSRDIPSPDVFNGGFGLMSAGIVVGGGGGCSKIRLGLAFSDLSCGGPSYGFDFSAGIYIGASIVTSSKIWDCGRCDD